MLMRAGLTLSWTREKLSFMSIIQRPRRLRRNAAIRRLVRETRLDQADLIQPLFIDQNLDEPQPVESMPGVLRYSLNTIAAEAASIGEQGVSAVILFGIPSAKDERASQAYAADGVIQQSIAAIKDRVPELSVLTDVCLCEYMSHGHCGIIDGEKILNDPTLELLAKTALSHAEAGADMVAPSDMMDGRVGVIRHSLDENGFQDIPLMSYAVKYASAFYGPFRDAAASAPRFGDRASYQMDPANIREALREAELDVQEGADILMVKPALPYLDVLANLRQIHDVPLAAYHVSGEYAQLKAAAERGWLDEKRSVLEALTSIKRAGADLILTYYAKQAAEWLND